MLITLETLVNKESPVEALKKFVRWVNAGYWTAHGDAFDVGNTTADSIAAFIQNGKPSALCTPQSNGNGALMRIGPLALFIDRIHTAPEKVHEICRNWSSLTHGHEISVFCCTFYTIMLGILIEDALSNKADNWSILDAYKFTCAMTEKFAPPECARLVSMKIHTLPESEIQSSGYVVHTLEAAIWCAINSSSYSEGVLKAVNLGEDTDTTGRVCGGILGVRYGRRGIPFEWWNSLARLPDINALMEKI